MSGSRVRRHGSRTRALVWGALVTLLIGLCPPSAVAAEVAPSGASLAPQPHHAHAGHSECCQPDCCSLVLRAVAKYAAPVALLGIEPMAGDPAASTTQGSTDHRRREAPPHGPPGYAGPLLR